MRPDSSDHARGSGPDPAGAEPPSEPAARRLGRTASLAVHLGITLVGVLGMLLALHAGIGSLSAPGPGLWPLAAASLATAAGLGTVVQTILGARATALNGSMRPAIGLGLAILFVLLFSFVSVIVALVVVFALWTRLLGEMPWPSVALWTVLGATLLYLLFGVLIATPFPAPLTVIP
ncbi:tripartite tricarboxylate transporter TctB family protein [Actinoalloteichus hymeniacidonis]|uniref:Tripartite tricarboxylate transporter TctB family n=1 Tax=Actinoalloteichus hymeniacidonis TaxID=340345 RepID=A0AAC9HQM9_9PSEU|nr:tripartite tricarboxylate transporter TctB family protein [Actinoalloteichus hymeniacidonis]AOS63802.1 Tripartite tricarboxylate transporter TctB family [Actinoalloteichus hymeniacidonis]MBB5908144.1 putative tricarboxylic transport membrane protein [Actinoalloteichus hymeniacidonis]